MLVLIRTPYQTAECMREEVPHFKTGNQRLDVARLVFYNSHLLSTARRSCENYLNPSESSALNG